MDSRTRHLGLAGVAALAFAVSNPLGKLTAPIPATTAVSACMGFSSLVLAAMSGRELVSSLRALSVRQRFAVVLAAGFLGVHFMLFLAGLQATSLAAAVALVSLEPVGVVLAAFLVYRIRPTRREFSGLVVAAIGGAIVASGAGSGENHLSGDLMEVGAVVFYGAYVAAARGLRDAMPEKPCAATINGIAALAFMPFALLSFIRAPAFPMTSIAAMVGLALIPTLVGYSLVQRTAREASPVIAALISPGETVGSLLIGTLFMGAAPTAREALGALCVIAGAIYAVTGAPSADA